MVENALTLVLSSHSFLGKGLVGFLPKLKLNHMY